jgi:hypothetical protein
MRPRILATRKVCSIPALLCGYISRAMFARPAGLPAKGLKRSWACGPGSLQNVSILSMSHRDDEPKYSVPPSITSRCLKTFSLNGKQGKSETEVISRTTMSCPIVFRLFPSRSG